MAEKVFVPIYMPGFLYRMLREAKRALTCEPPREVVIDISGERNVEWSFLSNEIPNGPGEALEFGCEQGYLSLVAAQKGLHVVANDLEPQRFTWKDPRVDFLQGDLLAKQLPANSFDVVINCSSVEHVGVAGRYGITRGEEEGDLQVMQRLAEVLKPSGKLLMTAPCGKDSMLEPWCRVYGAKRLPRLLEEFDVEREVFWVKNQENQWTECSRETALGFAPRNNPSNPYRCAYALGGFVLRKRRTKTQFPRKTRPSLTIFSTGKPFTGHNGIIQRNALKSWKLLRPEPEVILFGDEEGTAEVCRELGLRHEPRVERHESGMKYVDYLFRRAQEIAESEILCYANCDIVQMQELMTAVEAVRRGKGPFLLVGRRWDTEIRTPIDFKNREWAAKVRRLAEETGKRQDANFLDYFVFRKGLYDELPRLVLGRSYWDHWLVWKALESKARVVDCTKRVTAVHQNHDYGYHPKGKLGTNEDELARRNFALSGNGTQLRSLADATHAMTRTGEIYRTPLRRQGARAAEWTQRVAGFFGRQGFLNYTYGMRRRLGLRRENLRNVQVRVAGWFS